MGVFVCVQAQSCLTLCDPVDCSQPRSPVHGIFQTWRLEWVAISFSRGSFWPRDWTCVSYCQAGCLLLSHLGSPLAWVGRNNFLKKGHFKWTLNGCHFNRWWSVRGAWVEVLGRRAQARVPGGGKQVEAVVESFRSRQRMCRDKNGGGKKVLYLGNS